MRVVRTIAALAGLLALGGCNMVLLQPSGDVAIQQRDLLVISTALMLIIILPVMALTAFFAWHYRAGNKSAVYDPGFHHSTGLEVVIWSAPLLIVIALGALTWLGTHLLDPYRPLDRLNSAKPLADGTNRDFMTTKPLVIQVVALDWKWLFFYPEQGIATVNEIAAPVDRQIQFRITASSVMNSLFIPALAGQIYAMPGMETKLHAVINKPGTYEGFSANYSGQGFSQMRFAFRGLDDKGFEEWVGKARATGGALGRTEYTDFAKPSVGEPVRYFKDVDAGLYDAILNQCVDRAKMCIKDMAAIDARGGGGRAGIPGVMTLAADRSTSGLPVAAKPYVMAICTPEDAYGRGRAAVPSRLN